MSASFIINVEAHFEQNRRREGNRPRNVMTAHEFNTFFNAFKK